MWYIIFFVISLVLVSIGWSYIFPKTDGRTKTGYKDNAGPETRKGWGFVGAGALLLLLTLGQCASS